jgi:hypothetical protein
MGQPPDAVEQRSSTDGVHYKALSTSPKSGQDRRMGLGSKWRAVVTTVETALVFTAWVGGVAVSDLWIASVLFFLGATFGVVASIVDKRVVGKWNFILPGLVIFAFLLGEGLVVWRHNANSHDIQSLLRRPHIQWKEQSELISVETWLCGKDESALRDEFGFRATLDNTTADFARNGGPITERKAHDIKSFFMSVRHIHINRPIAVGGQYQVNRDLRVNKGEVGVLITSDQYESARKTLESFIGSPSLPADVRQALSNFSASIDARMNLMADVLTEYYKVNPEYIRQNNNNKSPLFADVAYEYLVRIGSMQQDAARVCDVVGKHLNADIP